MYSKIRLINLNQKVFIIINLGDLLGERSFTIAGILPRKGAFYMQIKLAKWFCTNLVKGQILIEL